ncbi:MAG: PAS domain S-box protein [Desulfovibrionaceae bacterium]
MPESTPLDNDALREENQRLRAALAEARFAASLLLQATQDTVLLMDCAGTVLEANPGACARLHKQRAELVGTCIFDLMPPELVANRRRWLKEAINTGKPLQFKDHWNSTSFGHRLTPVLDPLTGAVRVAVVTRDISESEQAFMAMRDNEARYRAIVEDQTELICRYRPDGLLSFVNMAYARFHGKEPRELINTRHLPNIPPEDWDMIKARIASLTRENPVTQFEHRVIQEDGSVIWQYWTHRAIFDAMGALVEYQAVGRGVTKRKLAEQELREHREFLHKIIDTVPNLIVVKNRAGEFVLVNRAMADLYGSTVEDMVGKRGADFNPHDDETALFRAEDLEVLDSRQPIFIPQRVISSAQGERRWFATVKLPLLDSDQVLGVSVDITDRKQAEAERLRLEAQVRQAQKMQALGTLAGGIAHDFNNMIFAILGFVRLALRLTEPDGKVAEYLRQIQSAGVRASDLVRQILTFSRRTEQEKKPVHLTALCDEVIKMLRATLPATVGISTDTGAANDTILGDPAQIHQVVMNLCANAGHAMGENQGTLSVRLRNVTVGPDRWGSADLEPGEYVELAVSDTGHGIPSDILDQIFDPFFTTKKPGEGTGMGLSVAHGIVRSHGGAITAESAPEKGATFRVVLPVLHQAQTVPGKGCEAVPRGNERILFVDDETLLVSMVHDMLTQLGYQVTAVNDPAEALARFTTRPDGFDLVISDQTMPHMTGALLAREMRSLRHDIPILLLTGFSESAALEKAKSMGVSECIMKPVVEEQLAQAIRRLLDATKQEVSHG